MHLDLSSFALLRNEPLQATLDFENHYFKDNALSCLN